MNRRLTVGATVAALTLSVVPAYAASQGSASAPRSAPAATPTRVPAKAPSSKATTATPKPSGTATTAPKPTPLPTPAPYAPPPDQAQAATPSAPAIKASGTIPVRVDRTGKQAFDQTWPDAGRLFTVSELAQVIPGVTAIKAHDCASSPVSGGRSSARSTRCTLDLTVKGEPADNRSRIIVSVRGFGVPAVIGTGWTRTLTQQRERAASRPGLYTFYKNGALGASASYTDGTTTRVLLQRGGAAGEVWFSGIGFAHLKPGYLASRQDYRQRVAPALAQLIADKVQPTL
ncbi:hypothetical protein [Luteipulveratus halotolerans]|uniref:Uncharacterized protein n=1 Tax=Luteipulveratus halotolerans TaxID=1631356 RepID=A0A0L6CIS6_9MICO|nr:hypothetical protein [Luteipulveratus halotolerans]KNX37702.1 hypothetical protein VV01_12005 [Luteipulveratus halotolerans]